MNKDFPKWIVAIISLLAFFVSIISSQIKLQTEIDNLKPRVSSIENTLNQNIKELSSKLDELKVKVTEISTKLEIMTNDGRKKK